MNHLIQFISIFNYVFNFIISKPTVSIENNLKIMQVQNKFIKFNLLDVPPPENNALLPFNENMKNFHAAIIVFDITQIISFNNIDRHYENIKKYSGKNNFPVFIIGNKSDLQSKRYFSYKSLHFLKRMKKSGYISR